MSEILEILMVVSFGASWPFNVMKSWKARTAKGKSLLFLCLILHVKRTRSWKFMIPRSIIMRLINPSGLKSSLGIWFGPMNRKLKITARS